MSADKIARILSYYDTKKDFIDSEVRKRIEQQKKKVKNNIFYYLLGK